MQKVEGHYFMQQDLQWINKVKENLKTQKTCIYYMDALFIPVFIELWPALSLWNADTKKHSQSGKCDYYKIIKEVKKPLYNDMEIQQKSNQPPWEDLFISISGWPS